MTELVVATRNPGKIRELEQLLAGVVTRVIPLNAFPDLPEVAEDGYTFEENAIKKARTAAAAIGLPVIADDSGLVVDALGGRPGVFSARFAGEGAGDAANNLKLLGEMAGIPAAERTAAFHCCLALCLPDGTCHTFHGRLAGVILEAPRGDDGFGYDPLFLVPEFGKTLAELPLEVKNGISHRGQALVELRRRLEGMGGNPLQ